MLDLKQEHKTHMCVCVRARASTAHTCMMAGFTRGPLLSMKGSSALLVVLIIDSLQPQPMMMMMMMMMMTMMMMICHELATMCSYGVLS